jgi:hypothetical protein
MIKKGLTILKKIIFAGLILYAYNIIAAPLNLMIPINIYTLLLVATFGVMAVPFLVLVLLVIF